MKTSIFSHCTDCHETQSHKPGRQAGFLHEYNDTHLLPWHLYLLFKSIPNVIFFTSFFPRQGVSLGGTFLVTGGGNATMETDEVMNLFQSFNVRKRNLKEQLKRDKKEVDRSSETNIVLLYYVS